MREELLENQTTVSNISVSLLKFTEAKVYINGIISELNLDRDLPENIQYEIGLTDQIGAYAFSGDTPKIVLTKGLLEFATRGELMAVLGHEASHILHHDLGLRIEENSCDLYSVERLIAHQVSPETMISFFRRMSKEINYDPKTFHINEMLHDEHSPFEQRIRNVQLYMANKNKYGEVKGLKLHSTTISSEIKKELEETVQRYLDQLPAEKPILPEQTVKDDPIARLHMKLTSLVETQAPQSDFRKLCEQLRKLKIDIYDIESFDKMNSLVDYAYHRLPEKAFIDIYRAAGFSVVPLYDERYTTLRTKSGGYFFSESRKKQSDAHLPAFSLFRQLQQSIVKFAKAKSFTEKVSITIEINNLIAKTRQLIPLFKQAGAIIEIAFDQRDYLYDLQRSMNRADMISDLHTDTSGQIVLMLWHLGFFKPPKEYDYLVSLNKLGFYKEVENYALDKADRAEFEMLIWDKMYKHHPDLIQRVITDPHHELFGVMLSDRIILGAERNKERPIRKKFSPELSRILRKNQVADIVENKEKYRQLLLNTDFLNETQRNDFLQRYSDVFHIVQVGDHFENTENQAIQVTLDIFKEMLEAENPQYVRSVVAFFQHLHSIVNYHVGAALSHTSSYAQFVVRHRQYFLREVTSCPDNESVLFNILFSNDEPVSLFLKDEQTISFLALAGVDSIDSMEALDKVVNFLKHEFRGLTHHFRDLVANEVEKSLPVYPFPVRPDSNRDYGYELINFASQFFSKDWTGHERRYNILAAKIAWRTDDESLYDHFTTDELSRIYVQFDLSSAFKSTEAKAFLEVLLLRRLSKPCNSPKERLLQQITLHNLLIMTYSSYNICAIYSVSDIQLRKRLINIWAENTRQFIAFIQSKKHKIILNPSRHNPADPKKFLSAFRFSDHEIIELMKNDRWKLFHEICKLYENSDTIILHIFENKSIRDQLLLLDVLSEALQFQRESLQKIKEKFDANLQKATDSTRRETTIAHEVMNASVDSILKLFSENDELRLATIQYLIEPVTFASARRMRDKLEQSLSPDQYTMLTRALGIIGFGVRNPSAYENNSIATKLFHFHREFHELSIEHKALGMANLLIPTKAVLTSESQAAAFSWALELVLDHLFPVDDANMDAEERQMARSFIEAYIEESPKYTDEFILAGLLAASHDNSQIGGKIHIGRIIASICEHMGPAYVKLAQALHSHPAILEIIKKDLKHVKANVRMPYRWEIAGKIQALRIKAQHIGRCLGAASYNIAVEITVDNKTVVLLLRHDEVIKQASYGFDHLLRTVSRWDHPAVEQMRDTLLSIISHTARALAQETDNEKLKQLERNAEQIYGNLTITVDNTQLQVRPMRTLVWEEQYRLLEQAQGVHFNDLPMDSPLRNAVAKAILVLELSNILSGGRFDSDRHGSQLRVDDHSIGLFDFGEMMRDAPTETDVTQLQRALPYMIGDAFTLMSNLQLPTFQDYLKQLDENNQPLSSFVTCAYRALLALQDYMTGLSTSDFLEVFTALQKVKFLNQDLLQTLQYTVRTTAGKIYQAMNPATWVAAYKLISSTLASVQANIKMSRPEPNAVTLGDDHPFDTLIWEQLPAWDSYTKQPIFSAEAYKNNASVGRFTLFGTVELCREKDGQRTNIVKTSGVFDKLAAEVNIDELQTCDVMPLTSYEIVKHELQQGAIMGGLHGISKVTERRLASDIAPMRAKVAGKLMLYGLYFNWAYGAYLLEQKEHDYGWLALLQASMDTVTMAALDLSLDAGSKLCALVSDKAEAANYITASKIIHLVGDNLGLGLSAYKATQKSLVSVGASIAGGFFAEKAIYLTASYAGIEPRPA